MVQPLVESRTRGQDAGRGILLMLLAMFLLLGMDALAKLLTIEYPVAEVLWSRFFFTFAVMAVVMGRRIPAIAASLNPRFQVLRGVVVLLTNACVILSMSYIPLAETSVLQSASPLFVALLSAPLLREPVGRRRMIGIVIGFIGVLVVVRPGAGILDVGAVAALASALLYAANQVTMRYLGGFDPPMTTVFFTALIGAVLSSVVAPIGWVTPSVQGWLIMLAMGVLSLLGQYVLVLAFSAAPAAVVSPFNYSSLVWAVLFGWLLFGDIPDSYTILGSIIIVASGIAVLRSR